MKSGVMTFSRAALRRLRLAGGLPNALNDQGLSAPEKIPKEQTIGRGNFAA